VTLEKIKNKCKFEKVATVSHLETVNSGTSAQMSSLKFDFKKITNPSFKVQSYELTSH
jgi:hypothetical protein